jgi:alpha-1,3-rhamnosyl/mannosyltransferase
MRVMIDATPLLLQSAGVKGVLYHWILALRQLAPPDSIHVYPPLPEIGPLRHDASIADRWTTARGIFMTVANQQFGAALPERLARGMDVFHCTNQIHKPPRLTRLTATIHDLTCWRMPELHTAANVKADHSYAERVLKTARGLIAVSENTRRDAIEILGISPGRITTIHNGVSEAFFDADPPPQPNKPYVLHTGTIEPRKNIDRLLDAWNLLPHDIRNAYDLVFAGSAGWASPSTVARLKAHSNGIRWLGYVPEDRLPALTRGAALVVYPSLYEGFGLPLAQAMACGVSCLTSNTSSLPEVAGDGALLVDPLSVAAIRDALIVLLSDAALRARLGAAGRARADACFHWHQAAQKSLAFFQRVLDA